MKRIVLILIVLFSVSPVFADNGIRYYKAIGFSYKYKQDNGEWTNWSEIEESNVLITMNLDEDVIFIYTPVIQSYKIVGYTKKQQSVNGGVCVWLPFIDQDGDKGAIRLRIAESGNSQLYVEYGNMKLAYNVILVLK